MAGSAMPPRQRVKSGVADGQDMGGGTACNMLHGGEEGPVDISHVGTATYDRESGAEGAEDIAYVAC